MIGIKKIKQVGSKVFDGSLHPDLATKYFSYDKK